MKIDRLISIIMVLLYKKRIAEQELAYMLKVSPRTIYRDIDTLNTSDIPIYSTPGMGGGFEIMPKYKLDKKFFSTIENEYHYDILLGLGDKCECLEPSHIRTK